MRHTPLRAVITAALVLTAGALSEPIARPDPPLCRVVAHYTPVGWPYWTLPEDRFRTIEVTLRPGCPPEGEAAVLLLNPVSGRTLPDTDAYTLNRYTTTLRITGLTPGWTVLWRSASGRVYQVPLTSTLAAP